MNFLAKDGFINTEEMVSLAREIDKYAAKEGLKGAEVYFVSKAMPKYDSAKAKKLGDAFTKKRAQIIKTKKRMPASGSRVRMMVLLRNYKGLEDTDFAKDFKAALKAIEQHNKVAEKQASLLKKEAQKKREAAAKEFDKNIKAMQKLLEKAGVKKVDIAIGSSMMGKSMLVKLPNGGVISIGKADMERFKKAKDAKDAEKETSPAKNDEGKKQSKDTKQEKKVGKNTLKSKTDVKRRAK